MKVSIIVAVAANRAIGKDNDLIWYLPRDLKFFKDVTAGHHVIMGRKNFLSIPEKYRPLPNRTNVVVTRNKDYTAEGCVVVHSIEEGLAAAKASGEDNAFIIGGGQIYQNAIDLNLVDEMYITEVHESFDADVFFPEIDRSVWKEVWREAHPQDDRHLHAYTFTLLKKSS